jgi:hypothetical protein
MGVRLDLVLDLVLVLVLVLVSVLDLVLDLDLDLDWNWNWFWIWISFIRVLILQVDAMTYTISRYRTMKDNLSPERIETTVQLVISELTFSEQTTNDKNLVKDTIIVIYANKTEMGRYAEFQFYFKFEFEF